MYCVTTCLLNDVMFKHLILQKKEESEEESEEEEEEEETVKATKVTSSRVSHLHEYSQSYLKFILD